MKPIVKNFYFWGKQQAVPNRVKLRAVRHALQKNYSLHPTREMCKKLLEHASFGEVKQGHIPWRKRIEQVDITETDVLRVVEEEVGSAESALAILISLEQIRENGSKDELKALFKRAKASNNKREVKLIYRGLHTVFKNPPEGIGNSIQYYMMPKIGGCKLIPDWISKSKFPQNPTWLATLYITRFGWRSNFVRSIVLGLSILAESSIPLAGWAQYQNYDYYRDVANEYFFDDAREKLGSGSSSPQEKTQAIMNILRLDEAWRKKSAHYLMEELRSEEDLGVRFAAEGALTKVKDIALPVVLEAAPEQGEEDGEVQKAKKVLSADPDNAEAYFYLATIYHRQGRLDMAKSAYQKTLEYAPEHAGAYNNLGLIYEKEGNPEAAIQAFRKAIGLNGEK